VASRITLYVDGRTEVVELRSRRYCDECPHWTRLRCTLLDVELPGYASPSRPALCLSAEGEARAREKKP